MRVSSHSGAAATEKHTEALGEIEPLFSLQSTLQLVGPREGCDVIL